ncbi:glycosyl hydrolase family 28-related protein [Nocardia crassostreae]|uniref:glycosyl hydrolase family 28-related protein n=1 Tax=Nocardia crassostreae TaxID=53428 RepID=UPI00082B1D40|nr:glycosyl hydrolase family 28-related protein [Nocardia crassostreae]
MAISRRRALLTGMTATAAAGVAGCAAQPADPPTVVSDLGGLVANARDFGIAGGETDESARLQNAIDYAHENGLALFLPAGRYTADGLLLREGTRLIGAGPEGTVIRAVPGSGNGPVLGIGRGPTRYVTVEGIGIEDAGNPDQHGIHIHARRGGEDTASGLWHSAFRLLRVAGFAGAQLWLQGGGHDARDPLQFLTFDGVILERRNDSERSLGLLMSGQVNQTAWTGGRIDGFGAAATAAPGINVKICRQLSGYDASDNGGPYLSDRIGHSHVFTDVTFQQAALGVFVDRAESITFDTCHFEGLGSGLLFSGVDHCRVDRCHFANSALGQGEPFSVRAVAGARVSGTGNVFLGRFGDMASADDSGASVLMSNGVGRDMAVTRNLTQRIEPAVEIDVGAAVTVALSASPTPVRVVKATHFPGERVVLKAAGGSVFFESGGNIDFENVATPLELRSGGTLTLVRFDSGPEWSIEAIHGAR